MEYQFSESCWGGWEDSVFSPEIRRKLPITTKGLLGFEPSISCLLDRRFTQLSHCALCFV